MPGKKTKYLYHIEDLPLVALTEQSKSRLVPGDKILVSFTENLSGCVFPLHSHPSEQVLIILEE